MFHHACARIHTLLPSKAIAHGKMRVHVLTSEEIFVQLVHGHEDRRPLLFISTSIITLVATIAVVLRFISARLNSSVLRADDYTIFVALV